jgi:hypothetical protein
LNNTPLNDQWVIEDIIEENFKFLESHENGNITYQGLWDITKAVLRGNLIAMSAYIKNREI